MEKTKNNFNCVAITFSSPIIKKLNYRLISASTCFFNKSKIEWQNLFLPVVANFFNYTNKKLIIIRVFKDKNKVDFTMSSQIMNHIARLNLNHMRYCEISPDEFISYEFIHYKFLKHYPYLNDAIYIFDKSYWFEVVQMFRELKIIITGGSSTKRHLLSPVHENMNLFAQSVKIKIHMSYHGEDIIVKNKIDSTILTNVNVINKENSKDLIDYKEINSNENNLNSLNNENKINHLNNKIDCINNPFNSKGQKKRQFHSSKTIRNNNNYDDLNNILIVKKILYKKLDNKIDEELFGFNLSKEIKNKLILIIKKNLTQKLMERERDNNKQFTSLKEAFIELNIIIDEYSILQEYINMVNKDKKKYESIETITEDNSTIDIMINQLQEKITFELRDIELNDEDYKNLFTIVWNKTN